MNAEIDINRVAENLHNFDLVGHYAEMNINKMIVSRDLYQMESVTTL